MLGVRLFFPLGTPLGTPFEKGYRMSTRVPPYCRQRESDRPDRAFCRIDGKKVFLGRYGSIESKAKYSERYYHRTAA